MQDFEIKDGVLVRYLGKESAVTVPDSVKVIGDGAFRDCDEIVSVVIPPSVTVIGQQSFRGCKRLASVTLPDSVTEIGFGAFEGCHALTSAVISKNVTVLRGFSDCPSLAKVTGLGAVTEIGGSAFCGCKSLTRFTVPDTVRCIGYSAFAECVNLISVDLPDSVQTICVAAFKGCKKLSAITLPSSVRVIEASAFESCESLGSLALPDSVTEIGKEAFYHCESLTAITVPFGVSRIESLTFGYCLRLEELHLPSSVTEIGSAAFVGCEALVSVTLPDSLKTVGSSAFERCRRLASVTLPDSVTEIGERAFSECAISRVVIPESVKKLGFRAFDGCPLRKGTLRAELTNLWPFPKGSLETLVLTDGTRISREAFRGYEHLTSVTLPDTLLEIGERAFYACTGLERIDLPDSLTEIGEDAFAGCSSLEEVRLGRSLYRVGEGAFAETALTSLEIPAETVRIRGGAFRRCPLFSCRFANPDGWWQSPSSQYYPGTEKGERLDVSDPARNAQILSQEDGTVYFRKRETEAAPCGYRFVKPVPALTETAFAVQGRYFEYVTPSPEEEAELRRQAERYYVRQNVSTEHDHDEYGSYETSSCRDLPVREMHSLKDPFDFQRVNGDAIVSDGRVLGFVLCFAFRGYKNAYDENILSLGQGKEASNSHLSIFYGNGEILGRDRLEYEDHSGRDWKDTTEVYSLTDHPRPDARSSEWR